MENVKTVVIKGYSTKEGEYLGNKMLEILNNSKSITGHMGKIQLNKGISFWTHILAISKNAEVMAKIEAFVTSNAPKSLDDYKRENELLRAQLASK